MFWLFGSFSNFFNTPVLSVLDSSYVLNAISDKQKIRLHNLFIKYIHMHKRPTTLALYSMLQPIRGFWRLSGVTGFSGTWISRTRVGDSRGTP